MSLRLLAPPLVAGWPAILGEHLLHRQGGDLRNRGLTPLPAIDRAANDAESLSQGFLSEAKAEPDRPELPPGQLG